MKLTLIEKNLILTLLLGFASFAPSVRAQEPEELSKVEVFGGYSLLRSEGENLHGWKAAVGFNVNRWLAIAVDADGHYFSESTPKGNLKEREYSLVVGPHFAYRNKSKFVPFAYAMPGFAWESSSLSGVKESHSGFAFETGGGVDLELSRKVAIRLFDVSASITHIGGHTSTKPKFSTGLVFHFGQK